eukprot:gb/GFBE01059397.1/.p1 GENE.gb/GFBE01059397.1/~~gb/GFBE01059397.1/.p1  ORF type:complete len:252 (+),score=57.91 gb/GFBE01059397.1/:1-756(+)
MAEWIARKCKDFRNAYVPDVDEIPPFARTLLGCTVCGCCLWLIFLIAWASTLSLTLEGIDEVWPEAECTVLGPGKVTTLATRCDSFEGNSCTGFAEYKNILSSVYVRYCRKEADGGLCFDVQADKCAFDSRIDLEQDQRYSLLTSNATTVPCWYFKEQEETQEAADAEATEASCSLATSENCTFFKTSKARYPVRLDAEPCVPRPVKGSVPASVALGVVMLLCGICCCIFGFRARYELQEDEEEEFTDAQG